MGEWIGDKHLVSSAKRKRWEKLRVRGRSLMKMMNRSGPRILPCGIPDRTGRRFDC